MKKLFLFLFALFFLSESGAGEKPFARFRQLAAKVQKRSQADYALGRELAKAMLWDVNLPKPCSRRL